MLSLVFHMSYRGTLSLVPLIALVGQMGCAAMPVTPPSEEIRAHLGTVGLASARFAPRAGHDKGHVLNLPSTATTESDSPFETDSQAAALGTLRH